MTHYVRFSFVRIPFVWEGWGGGVVGNEPMVKRMHFWVTREF